MRNIKKQIWLSNDEAACLKLNSERTCLREAEYIRMLLRDRVPKEKPDEEFYELMSDLSRISDQIDILLYKLKQTDSYSAILMQEEIHRWHQFQLAIEERFLAPEKVPWL